MVSNSKSLSTITATASRRRLLKGAAALGLAATGIPGATFAPAMAAPARQNAAKTLTVAVNGSSKVVTPATDAGTRRSPTV